MFCVLWVDWPGDSPVSASYHSVIRHLFSPGCCRSKLTQQAVYSLHHLLNPHNTILVLQRLGDTHTLCTPSLGSGSPDGSRCHTHTFQLPSSLGCYYVQSSTIPVSPASNLKSLQELIIISQLNSCKDSGSRLHMHATCTGLGFPEEHCGNTT